MSSYNRVGAVWAGGSRALLDEVLRGVQTFGIELNSKIHLRDFRFARRSRAWDRIPASAFDAIYGDRYQIVPEAVTEIGNNVSLVFRELNLGGRGASGILLRGRSSLKTNTIHLLFRGGGLPEERRVVEFSAAADWTERLFPFEPVYGAKELTFLFLPGSRFDFADFQFT